MENELAQILGMASEQTYYDAFLNDIAQHPDMTTIQTLLEKWWVMRYRRRIQMLV
ncbi:hypothetical protein AAHB43_01430 [Staphylococcus pseudintermedius]